MTTGRYSREEYLRGITTLYCLQALNIMCVDITDTVFSSLFIGVRGLIDNDSYATS